MMMDALNYLNVGGAITGRGSESDKVIGWLSMSMYLPARNREVLLYDYKNQIIKIGYYDYEHPDENGYIHWKDRNGEEVWAHIWHEIPALPIGDY